LIELIGSNVVHTEQAADDLDDLELEEDSDEMDEGSSSVVQDDALNVFSHHTGKW